MKKIIASMIVLSVLITGAHGYGEGRTCETVYSTIGGISYFSGLHCTEKISLNGVTADESALRDVSTRKINDFIISNNYKIQQHVDDGAKCDEINSLEEIKAFENVIYENNNIAYTETSTSIETLTQSIEDGIEEYNSEDLYNIVFDETKLKYPSASIDFQRSATREEYFDRQLAIKNTVLANQKEKLTSIYKLTESQKFIEGFYTKVTKICDDYYKDNAPEEVVDSEKTEIDEDELQFAEFKEDFNEKLGATLDKLPRQSLQQLSVKLLTYADTSPLFKRFTPAQQVIVKLKIKALKAVIDDRIID